MTCITIAGVNNGNLDTESCPSLRKLSSNKLEENVGEHREAMSGSNLHTRINVVELQVRECYIIAALCDWFFIGLAIA